MKLAKKYSSCESELLKRFSRSEVKGQGHMCECYNGGGIHYSMVWRQGLVVLSSLCHKVIIYAEHMKYLHIMYRIVSHICECNLTCEINK